MTAKYDFKTSPDIQGDKEQATLYPQLVVSGTKDLTDLAKEIARRSTIKEGTVMGLFCDLENIIANYLADAAEILLLIGVITMFIMTERVIIILTGRFIRVENCCY